MKEQKKELVREAIATAPDFESRAGKFLTDILKRSSEDWDFRQQLLADPNAALAQHLGQDARDNAFDIVFVENKADVTIVLPDAENAELSEEELEAVAGGEGALAVAASVVAVIGSCLAVYDAWFD